MEFSYRIVTIDGQTSISVDRKEEGIGILIPLMGVRPIWTPQGYKWNFWIDNKVPLTMHDFICAKDELSKGIDRYNEEKEKKTHE